MSNQHLKYTSENNQSNTPQKQEKKPRTKKSNKLPPHPYKTADDAYRAMMRGLENGVLMNKSSNAAANGGKQQGSSNGSSLVPTNQSILVSGESGAGKTVTTKIVLNYFAMLSKKVS